MVSPHFAILSFTFFSGSLRFTRFFGILQGYIAGYNPIPYLDTSLKWIIIRTNKTNFVFLVLEACMTNEWAVQISGLQVRYGRQTVLTDLSVTLPRGQIIGILGPSGSGKTTLVKAIMGLNRIRKGSISILGHRVPSLAALDAVGYMAQENALYEDLTAMDNLLFFARLCGLTRAEAAKRARQLFDFVGLTGEEKKIVGNYSGGMQRRLSLAVALIGQPPLLLLDEPTVGIDPVLRQKFWREFETLKAQGSTLLATTHVMDEASRCDRLLLLREGRIIANGTVPELLDKTGTNSVEEAFLRFSSKPLREVG